MKILFFILLLVAQTVLSFGQIDSLVLRFPENAELPEKFKIKIAEQSREFHRLFRRDSSIIMAYTPEFILDKIDHDSNYEYIFRAEYWIAFNYKEIIPSLIKRLTDKTEIGLTNSADLIIVERINSKQMKSYGHGGVSYDDLFTVAGRANRLLTEITGENFGHVSMYSTEKQLKELKRKWLTWLINL